jgi:hypothetical protein
MHKGRVSSARPLGADGAGNAKGVGPGQRGNPDTRAMQKLSIGRSATNDVVVNDRTVSRVHAEIFVLADGQFRLVDNASANGTFVKIASEFHRVGEAQVEAGDVVRFGDYVATVGELVDQALDHATTRRRGDERPPAPSEPHEPEPAAPEARPLDPISEVRPTNQIPLPTAPAPEAAPAAKPSARSLPRRAEPDPPSSEQAGAAPAGAAQATPARKGMGTGMIVLICVGGCVLLAALIYLALFLGGVK